jgi:hypothetical protein
VRLRTALTSALALAALTGACDEGTPESADAVDRYVALGDSFTSAPGVPVTDQTTGCLRSDHNYPALLATSLGVTLVDVSCGSADTTAIEGVQQTPGGPKPPQLDAVDGTTDLVTVGIGINDFGLYSSLLFNCPQLAATDPGGAPCRDSMATEGGGDRLVDTIEQIGPRVEAVLLAVADKAPRARVVLVGYPQFVPESGRCEALPLAEGDYAYLRDLAIRLGDALERAADAADADYLDLVEASAGHDICAGADAWVNGALDDPERAVLYHPFPEGQEAVARLIEELL